MPETSLETDARPLRDSLALALQADLKAEEAQIIVEEAGPPPERWAHLILQDAAREKASDIHLDPSAGGVRVRLRIDGLLHDAVQLSQEQGMRLIRHYKTMAGLDPVATFLPQDARIEYELDGRKLDLRVACAPSRFGEKLALRLLDPQRVQRRIKELGLSAEHEKQFEGWISEISGMCLVCGPIGSGKTTTLYALLHELRLLNKAVITIEDPVEYHIDGITQIQVDLRHGMSFSQGIKGMLRLDPDFILVGEIRDHESARAAVEVSASGRVVMSTLHARDIAGVLTTLRNWRIENHEIATAVELVIAQRLVRCLCTKCRRLEAPNASEKAWLAAVGQPAPAKTWHAIGCAACRQTGYLGRTGLFEIWRKDDADYDLILAGTDELAFRRHIRQHGRACLLNDGLTKAESGATTLAEVRGVLGQVGVACSLPGK